MTDQVVLISTYELGRQPFGIAAPAALLREAGADVTLLDLSLASLDEDAVRTAGLVMLYVPMHTAARLSQPVIAKAKDLNPGAHYCVYGLYAPLNEHHFRSLGVDTILGGECESRLVELFREVSTAEEARAAGSSIPVVSLDHQPLVTPDRTGLPGLAEYAQLVLPSGEQRVVGYTEASRGCRHSCRHCPIVPVYGGRFLAVPRTVVLDDVRQQVATGAEHITFGDPDFFNGPAHAMRLVRQLHEEFPSVSYDVTIKVEHLRRHLPLISELKATGCVLITTAVESFDPEILARFDKQHDPEDVTLVVAECRQLRLALNPTFVAFTPWTTLAGYRQFLDRIIQLDLVGSVSPVQYGIRLLITADSRLLELPEVAALVDRFDDEALCYPWEHADPHVDALWRDVSALTADHSTGDGRMELFAAISRLAGKGVSAMPSIDPAPQPVTVPYLTEPWYC